MIKTIGIRVTKNNTSVDIPAICSMDYGRCVDLEVDSHTLFCYNLPLPLSSATCSKTTTNKHNRPGKSFPVLSAQLLGDMAMRLREYPAVSVKWGKEVFA